MLTESSVADTVSPKFLSTAQHIHVHHLETQPNPESDPQTERQTKVYLCFRSQIKFTVL